MCIRDRMTIAGEGLDRIAKSSGEPSDRPLLASLEERAREGRCPAQSLLKDWEGRDPAALLARL